MQRKACSCVEGSEWETRLQERFEDFFSVYDKTLLNRKGKLKDKKLWKSWRGRRPQMFYRLIMRFRDNDTVKLRSRQEASSSLSPKAEKASARPDKWQTVD